MSSLIAVLGGVILLYLAIIIFMIASMWKIYAKAGKPGWAAIVPIYNLIVLFEIVGKPWWWLFLCLIPGVNIIFLIWTYNLLSKSFGKDVGFTIGLIFLSFVFFPILGFGSAKYVGPAGSPAGDLGTLDSPK
jgi:Family of unknown function (DUF5684)